MNKHILTKLGPGMLSLLLLLTLTATATAQTSTVITANTLFDVNVRATPGISSGVIAVLPTGAQAVVIGRSPDNNWVQVEYEGNRGWAAAWLLIFSNDTFPLDVTTDLQPVPLAFSDEIATLSPYNLNMRTDANNSADIIGTIPFATEVTATGRNATSSWVRVEYGNKEGWVAAWLVTMRNDINGLPVDTTAFAPPSGGSSGVNEPASPVSTPVTPIPSAPAGPATGIFVTAPYRVNIRTAPSVNANVLDIMAFGAQASAVGRNAVNNWIQVKYGETVGWVAAWVVVASDNTANLPVASDVVDVAPIPTGTQITGSSIYAVVIRSGPSLTFGPVGEVPANTNANLLGRTEDSAWVKVNYEGVEGWVAAWVMVASADMNNLPVQDQ